MAQQSKRSRKYRKDSNKGPKYVIDGKKQEIKEQVKKEEVKRDELDVKNNEDWE
jgi:hypothetical protein